MMHGSEPQSDNPLCRATVHRALVALAVLGCALSVFKGLRLPNLWSATHFVLNYSQGFVRRGLVGELARHALGDAAFRYFTFVGLALLGSATVSVALVWLVKRALQCDADDTGYRVALLAFVASPGLVMLVHLVGYLDFLGLLVLLAVTAGACASQRTWWLLGATLAAGVILPFVHEVLNVMFVPALGFVLGCHLIARSAAEPLDRRHLTALVAAAATALAVPCAVSAIVSTLGTPDAQRIEQLQTWLGARVDFQLRPDAFAALSRSSYENVTQLMPWYWSSPARRLLALQSATGFAPGYAFLLVYGWRAAGRAPRAGALLRFAFLGAALGPLVLNFVGWDYSRWFSVALVNAFVCVTSLALLFPTRVRERSPRLLWFGLGAFCVGLASDYVLFDQVPVSFFPFVQKLELLQQLLDQGGTFRPPS